MWLLMRLPISGSETLSALTGEHWWPVSLRIVLLRWDQVWLKEGFAEHLSNVASHYIDPEIHTWERFYVEETQWVMYQDQDTRNNWAMTDPITTRSSLLPTKIVQFFRPRDDIDRKFGDSTYMKGASFNRMVSEVPQFSNLHLLYLL